LSNTLSKTVWRETALRRFGRRVGKAFHRSIASEGHSTIQGEPEKSGFTLSVKIRDFCPYLHVLWRKIGILTEDTI